MAERDSATGGEDAFFEMRRIGVAGEPLEGESADGASGTASGSAGVADAGAFAIGDRVRADRVHLGGKPADVSPP